MEIHPGTRGPGSPTSPGICGIGTSPVPPGVRHGTKKNARGNVRDPGNEV